MAIDTVRVEEDRTGYNGLDGVGGDRCGCALSTGGERERGMRESVDDALGSASPVRSMCVACQRARVGWQTLEGRRRGS